MHNVKKNCSFDDINVGDCFPRKEVITIRISPNNSFANANFGASRVFGNERRTNNRNARLDNIMQQRAQERKMEMQMREREDARIARLEAKIKEAGKSDMDFELRSRIISGFSDQINRILEGRAEREMMRKKAAIEENTRPGEEKTTKNETEKCPEEAEDKRQRNSISSLTRIAAEQDNMANLKRVRANLSSEAGHLERAMSGGNSNYANVGIIPLGNGETELIFHAQSGFGNNDFRNRQLSQLNEGIAGLDAALKMSISNMYRESAKMQESQLADYRKEAGEEDNDENSSMDSSKIN